MHTPRRLWRSVMWLTVLWLTASGALAAERGHCGRQAGPQCLHSFALPAGAGQMHYYASRAPRPGDPHGPQTALLILHGHPRDVGRSFEAGLQAARAAGRLPRTLVVAPLYQVAPAQAGRCSMPDTPGAQPGDALWSCAGWLAGAPSLGAHPLGAFAALDALLGELARQWPSLRSVTLVGFSAGAQMLQHSIGFAADPPAGVALRYVIADPGSWLYFDPVRPVPLRGERTVPWEACGTGGCTWRFDVPATSPACAYDHWKYGTQSLPGYLPRTGAQARAHYAAAQVDYLEGALDSSADKGTFYPILDKSCAAMLQGPFRLQRGLAYAAYEQAVLKPRTPRRMIIVPGCAHDVACVLGADAARPVLFAPPP